MLYFWWRETKLDIKDIWNVILKDWHALTSYDMYIVWCSPCDEGLPWTQCTTSLPQQTPHIQWWTSCLQTIVQMNTWQQVDRAQSSLLVHHSSKLLIIAAKQHYTTTHAHPANQHVTYMIKFFLAHVASSDRRRQPTKSNSRHNTWLWFLTALCASSIAKTWSLAC